MPKQLPVQFGAINDRNIETLRKLNKHIFPVHYSDNFYNEVLKARYQEYKLFAYYQGIIVGVICCRVEKSKEEGVPPGTNVLYIMIIGVLPNYRGRGIGRQMLEKVLTLCAEDKAKVKPTKIYLHVQTSNEAAQKFYGKFGFSIGRKIEGYYHNIDPPDCYILAKDLSEVAPRAAGADGEAAAAKGEEAEPTLPAAASE